MNSQKMYISTGEFARLCRVSKHTLFHYNDVGIFMPQYIDENGYRYYHVLQYDTFCTITQLRTSGMTLHDIKDYLEKRSSQNLIDLCSKQESLIDMQIKQLRQIKNNLSTTRQGVTSAVIAGKEIFIRQEDEEYLQLSQSLSQANDVKMTLAFGELLQTVGSTMFRNVSGMMHRTDDLIDRNYDQQYWFYLRIPHKKKTCNYTIKSAGNYLTTYHHGNYETLPITYKNLLAHAEHQCLTLGDWFYEEMVIGDWATKSDEDYVLKVSVQIQRNE